MVYPLDYRFLCFMGMIYIMLIVSLIMAVFFLIIFMWAAKTGQYEDDYAPSVRPVRRRTSFAQPKSK